MGYIHENPIRAGIVERAEDYVYSSAKAITENETIQVKLSYWDD